MVTTADTATMFSAGVALRRLAAFGVLGAGITGAHVLFGIGLPCPLLALTGIQCPLCGSTRAAGALAHGDLAAAWSYNAMLVIGIAVAAMCATAWTVELAGGPALRPPRRLRPFTQNRVYTCVAVVAAVFMLVRNFA